MTTPLISVVLPVYNGAGDVEKAVDSILTQTFTDYELIIINDGSKDDSASVLESLRDPRIRLYHQDNMGLAGTLNRGIDLARGRYIARQDQDDLSHPERFARQVEFLENNPEHGLLGTAAQIWVGDTPTERAHDHPTEHGALSFELLFNNPFVHSSIMMRKATVEAVGGYTTDAARQPPEDYELWSRMARRGRVANLAERLLIYREVPASMSRTGPNPFMERLVLICAENIAAVLGQREPSQYVLDVAALTHSALHRLSPRPDIERMCQVVRDAGQRLAAQSPQSDVPQRMEARIQSLRHQYLIQKHNMSWARPIARAVRDFGRRLGILTR
ncbi:glycosyltransferase family 2 protein [Cupriavidus consociatus]|uniref:glycosyltransferase family 2 protein n=1 Tax=Cupriavidus consociatus TaxID=2821357 RepID=UPI001AE48759|nr:MULTISPECIES: glycosyltransferase family A protein [unclassified Cupriavidus]MBP0621451.1 glycosyltransferase family 2 protein [Cupriavidus sp. LEh25]MDK2658124.1 glycosyltransferase family A protein [Cupriavidus sp. LEh21]